MIPVVSYMLRPWPEDTRCWDLVQQVYRETLRINVGSVEQQDHKLWLAIDFNELEEGDMVLFRSGLKRKHAGVHVTDAQFFHYMENVGPVLSRYTDPGWRKIFHKAYRWRGRMVWR